MKKLVGTRGRGRFGGLMRTIALGVLAIAASTSGGLAADEKSEMEAWAERFEFRASILGHDTGFLLDAGPRNDVYAVNAELLFPSPDFPSFAFSPRPKIGVNLAPDADGISVVYAGLNWDVPVYGNWFVMASVGGALNNADRLTETDLQPGENKNTRRLVGCHALFHLSVGFGYRVTEDVSVSFYGDHISNANLCDNNEGLDQWGVRLGYAF